MNVATCGDDATVKLWDYETGEFEKTLKSHINAVNHVSYNSDGSLLASCSADLSIKLWSTKTYTVVRTLMGHDHNVSCVRFFPDGKLFSCSRDSTVRVWDASTYFIIILFCLGLSHTFYFSYVSHIDRYRIWNNDNKRTEWLDS